MRVLRRVAREGEEEAGQGGQELEEKEDVKVTLCVMNEPPVVVLCIREPRDNRLRHITHARCSNGVRGDVIRVRLHRGSTHPGASAPSRCAAHLDPTGFRQEPRQTHHPGVGP